MSDGKLPANPGEAASNPLEQAPALYPRIPMDAEDWERFLLDCRAGREAAGISEAEQARSDNSRAWE